MNLPTLLTEETFKSLTYQTNYKHLFSTDLIIPSQLGQICRIIRNLNTSCESIRRDCYNSPGRLPPQVVQIGCENIYNFCRNCTPKCSCNDGSNRSKNACISAGKAWCCRFPYSDIMECTQA